jgi:hypothetical protein
MAAGASLVDRIDAEFSAADKRIKEFQSQRVEAFQDRQQRLEKFTLVLEQLRDIWKPRLETLAKKFGDRVAVQPQVEPGRRSATFEFDSELARIKLRFGVAPDSDVRNLVFTYDLDIMPILMKFDSHEETEIPLDAVNESTLGQWFDDRIVSFVQTYLSLHENQYYLKDHMVEDPIARVQFPKYAAGAELDVNGKKIYFLDDTTLRKYQQQQSTNK